MNIILIGMRGSGKTTVGKFLSIKLDRPLIEVDDLIEAKSGEKIADYVKKNGWEKFRDCEAEVLSEVAKLDNTIISCGGGVVERSENIQNLKRHGFLIFLSASIDTLYNRIGEDKNRPLLSNANSMKTDLENMLKNRKVLYGKAADLIITVNNKTVGEICREIIKSLKNKYD